MKPFYLVFLSIVLVSTAGCSTYIQRPVVKEKLEEKVHLISTSASRRANFLADYTKGYFVCMEPQPDVRENISKALVAGLQAGTDKTDTTKKASAAANMAAISALATAAVQRSVALEYFRTGIFALCQQKYNQSIRNPNGKVRYGYEALDLKQLFDRAAEIAMIEAISSANRNTAADGSQTSSQTLIEQLDELSQLYNKVRETITPPNPASPEEAANPDS